mmetsp:Transcript_18732/g.52363  ORF Transcript_18732/g.52363 Transcript_18732/m.52363 type:complete len:87 (+) Transcript_18732:2732-2992(+)
MGGHRAGSVSKKFLISTSLFALQKNAMEYLSGTFVSEVDDVDHSNDFDVATVAPCDSTLWRVALRRSFDQRMSMSPTLTMIESSTG